MPRLPGIHVAMCAAVALIGGLLAHRAAGQTAPAERAATRPTPMALGQVRSFMYQLQNLEDPVAVEALARSSYDMLVVEPTGTLKDHANFDTASMVRRLHAGRPGRLVIAYLDACQAESYRTYWKANWKAPTKKRAGTPDFLLRPDPDGWSDDYVVAYWDKRWQEIFATGPASEVHAAMAAGFDGVYLDWIDAYDDPTVAAAVKRQSVAPATEMVDFLRLIRREAQSINPRAVVIQQNAVGLLEADPRLAEAIDGLGVEDTWFSGKANAKWESRGAGDVPNRERDESSTANRLATYKKYQSVGKPVFTVDYALKPENVQKVYTEATKAGLIPLVTRVSLDHLTTTPPPSLGR